jgi:hypothetical protein
VAVFVAEVLAANVARCKQPAIASSAPSATWNVGGEDACPTVNAGLGLTVLRWPEPSARRVQQPCGPRLLLRIRLGHLALSRGSCLAIKRR